jgi:hypothetical protein
LCHGWDIFKNPPVITKLRNCGGKLAVLLVAVAERYLLKRLEMHNTAGLGRPYNCVHRGEFEMKVLSSLGVIENRQHKKRLYLHAKCTNAIVGHEYFPMRY